MRGDVEADLGHDFDGEGMDVAGGLGAGAGDGVASAQGVAEDAFGEVGAAGVAGAEDEDNGGHGGEGALIILLFLLLLLFLPEGLQQALRQREEE